MTRHVDVMYDVMVCLFLSKIVCGAKNIKTYILRYKNILSMKRTVSQMNPNDNQVVQCCDGYVMTSP